MENEAVAEARGEPQGVQDGVEEAGVAEVGKGRDSRAVGTPLVPVHTVHRPLLGLSGQGAKAIAPSCPFWLSDCLLDLVYFRASATTFALPRFTSRSLDLNPGQAVVKGWTRTQHSAPPSNRSKIATGV